MTKTIVLTDLVVNLISIDYPGECVHVKYSLLDANTTPHEKGEATFWVTMPAEPTENDFQLPSGYIPTLLSLRDDADTALTNRFLV